MDADLYYRGPLPKSREHVHAEGTFCAAPTAAYPPGLCSALAKLASETLKTSINAITLRGGGASASNNEEAAYVPESAEEAVYASARVAAPHATHPSELVEALHLPPSEEPMEALEDNGSTSKGRWGWICEASFWCGGLGLGPAGPGGLEILNLLLDCSG